MHSPPARLAHLQPLRPGNVLSKLFELIGHSIRLRRVLVAKSVHPFFLHLQLPQLLLYDQLLVHIHDFHVLLQDVRASLVLGFELAIAVFS